MFPSISTEDTLPSISTEDTLPSISTEDTLPSISTEDTLPSISTEDTLPSISTEDTLPSISTEDTLPSISTEDTSPSISTEDTSPSISTDDTSPTISTDDTSPSISTDDTSPSTSTGQNEKESLPAIDVGERNEQELCDFVLERFSLKRPRPTLTNRSATLRWDPEKNTIKVYMDVLGLMREHMNPDAQLFDAKMFMQDSLTLPAFEDLKDALVDPSNPVKEEIFLDELGVARIKEVSIEEDNAGTQEVSIEQANVVSKIV
ncbi:zonadhesin-like [Palaemon carinicauda]|uniref:zonadhesin-like n=1 Tax=Palaemon carinicauda TaxID=392227 RepID=UPI0035B60A25